MKSHPLRVHAHSAPAPSDPYSARRRLLVFLITTLGSLLLSSVPAQALTTHVFTSDFGAAGSTPANPYPLLNPADLAVDNSSGASQHDIYVTDPANHRVEKFDSAGNFILMFGKDVDQTTGGNVCPENPGDICQPGTEGSSPGEFATPTFVAVDSSSSPSAGDVYIGDTGDNRVSKFDPSGNLIANWATGGQLSDFSPLYGIAVDPSGNLFVLSGSAYWYEQSGTLRSTFGVPRGTSPAGLAVDAEEHLYKADGSPEITKFSDTGDSLGEPDTSGSTVGFTIDPSSNDLYAVEGGAFIDHFALNCGQGCTPLDSFGTGNLTGAEGISIDATSDDVYVANTGEGNVAVFDGAGPYVTTGAYSNLGSTSATVSGMVNPAGRGNITNCQFEYGSNTLYGSTVPCTPNPASNPPSSNFTAPTEVTASLTGLEPGTTYHVRLSAGNSIAAGYGHDQTFSTLQPPSISGAYSSELSETTATLHAKVNANGSDTKYYFEYGLTAGYGTSTPEVDIGSSEVEQAVEVKLSNLQSHSVYHFRVVATNALGTVATEDQTFNFFPPSCPNAALRQQTGTEYLPDCRAYELVSPSNAGNVVFFPTSAPAATEAENHFAFGGGLGAVQGTNPPDSISIDTYVATRTSTGWVTHYVGLKGSETLGASSTFPSLNFEKFIDFDTGEGFGGVPQPPSRAPYVWDANGNSLGRWPANLAEIAHGDETHGAFQPSGDFSHLALSSNNIAFTPEGLTSAPGSAYDYDTATETMTLISKTPTGENIPGQASEFIEFPPVNTPYGYPSPFPGNPNGYPGVSTNGSHILMWTSPSGVGDCFSNYYGCPEYPGRLYMRINDAATYEIAGEHEVTYVGMTPNGSKVFFTSPEQLTSEEHAEGTALYMWSAEKAENDEPPLTLISIGSGGSAASESCSASWTAGCGVIPARGSRSTDREIATETGEIYFYSPQQLDGPRGIRNQENLYVYRNGHPQFVASLTPGAECTGDGGFEEECGEGPLSRIQVAPNGAHVAFLTASQLTSADTGGFQEMYSYEPASEKITCDSCNPDGEPPTGNTLASDDGLFMSDDGRTFFYTPDALVPQDTDNLKDVYEYVEGRPQLITPGTENEDTQRTPNQVRPAGLEGVSANGVNVYFGTYSTLVGQDQNGQFLKFYDARTDGGFPFVPPAPPCEAADECHGVGSEPPSAPNITSGAAFGSGGNATPEIKKPKRHKPKKHKTKSAHRVTGKHKSKRHHRRKRTHQRRLHDHRLGGRRGVTR